MALFVRGSTDRYCYYSYANWQSHLKDLIIFLINNLLPKIKNLEPIYFWNNGFLNPQKVLE